MLNKPPHPAPPGPSDGELVTLAVPQALLGLPSERRGIRHARAHPSHLFPYWPYCPDSPTWNGADPRSRERTG